MSGGSGSGHGWIAQVELLKLKKNGQFLGESVRIKGSQIHYVNSQASSCCIYYESIK